MWTDKLFHRAIAQVRSQKDEETGSLTIFSLFLFIMILFVAGMAVDLMQYERNRAGLQNAMDSGVIAASSLTQGAELDAELEALVKDYVQKAGYNPDLVNVVPNTVRPDGTTATSRSVTATANFQSSTMFMNLLGVNTLKGQARGAALEGSQVLEIALVLDISGSMSWGSKMDNLKTAAKEFVTTIIDNSDASRVSISIIPYNQQVYMSTDLMARLNPVNTTTTVPGPYRYGQIETYSSMNPATRCAAFTEDDFRARSLVDGGISVTTSASFSTSGFNQNKGGVSNTQFAEPEEFSMWCGNDFPKVLLYENNETTLHTFIDGLSGFGYTAIDIGMNWGVGVLDPSFSPVVDGMVTDGLLSNQMRGRPVAYQEVAEQRVKKYVVLMTDGRNTDHFDLQDAFKQGPSPVWYSETLANGTQFDGYAVQVENNPASKRWFVPGDPNTTNDDYFLAAGASQLDDATQWSYHELYRKFRAEDVAQYFFEEADNAALYNAHNNAVRNTGGYGAADDKVQLICDAAQENDRMTVFTVAFEAPETAQTVLDDCAKIDGNYFPVSGAQISEAFKAIAVQISVLRLTQ